MGKTYISPSGLAKEVQKIYYGNENNLAQGISKVYVGDSNGVARLVFGNSAILPREYQQVEYIYNTKYGLYIDTGLVFRGSNKLVCRTQYYQIQHSWTNWNGDAKTSYNEDYFGHDNNGYFVRTGYGRSGSYGYLGATISSDDTNIHEFTIDHKNKIWKVDNTSRTDDRNLNNNSSGSIYLFAGRSGSSYNNAGNYQRLYSFKWYTNDILTRSFYPCYRKSDNVVGLYEIFTNTFFPNCAIATLRLAVTILILSLSFIPAISTNLFFPNPAKTLVQRE